jgi:squalene-associated FAD-dependent desaturase
MTDTDASASSSRGMPTYRVAAIGQPPDRSRFRGISVGRIVQSVLAADSRGPSRRRLRALAGGADRVVVVGGGLAGIAAALGLAEAGVPVTLLEARPWLGGATWSFGRRGLTIDNGQHAFLRCFTAYRDLLGRLGVSELAPVQDRLDLTVLTGDGSVRLTRSGWPAPLHLAGLLARYRPLTVSERLGVLPAALALWLTDLSGTSRSGACLGDWLARHGQGERARRDFWDMFLLPALNSPVDQADLGTAAGLLNAALLNGRDHADLGLASVPLRDLHAAPASRRLGELGAEVRLGAEVMAIGQEKDGSYVIRLAPAAAGTDSQPVSGARDRGSIRAAAVVLAVPAWTAATLVPADLAAEASAWDRLQPSPVVSIHVIYDISVTSLPFATALRSPVRWVADKTRSAGLHAGQYLAATLPDAGAWVDATPAAFRERILPQLEQLFPAAASARVEDFFVTRERTATIRPAPGWRALRPAQATALARFALAGAWTSTGWPDTMEGAVRSGMLAAQQILRELGDSGEAGASTADEQAKPDVAGPATSGAAAASVPAVAKAPAVTRP